MSKKKPESEYLPVVEGAKTVSKAAVRGAKDIATAIFPSREAQVRREKRKLVLLEKQIELIQLQHEKEKLLKKLESLRRD